MLTDSQVNTPRAEVVRHRVRKELQKLIVQGDQLPGSKLVQKLLAEQLGVAQGVVREALIELQSCGLVETIDNRGMFVTNLNREMLLESFDVREVHEGLAARLCCDCVTRSELRKLEEIAKELYKLSSHSTSGAKSASLDRSFHHRILELSGNSMLVRLADNYILLGKVVQAHRPPKTVLNEHLAIVKAIREGQPDVAERLSREHIRAAKIAVGKNLSKETSYNSLSFDTD